MPRRRSPCFYLPATATSPKVPAAVQSVRRPLRNFVAYGSTNKYNGSSSDHEPEADRGTLTVPAEPQPGQQNDLGSRAYAALGGPNQVLSASASPS
jgi:hypothetical protein